MIEYFESIVQFAPPEQPIDNSNKENNNNNAENNSTEDNKDKIVKVKTEEIIGLENLNRSIVNGNGDALMDSQVVKLLGLYPERRGKLDKLDNAFEDERKRV